jgi:hypothetical protein
MMLSKSNSPAILLRLAPRAERIASPCWRRKTAPNSRNHARDVRIRLRERHSRFEPGNRLVTELPEIHLVAVELNGQDDRGIVPVEEVKSLRHHTDDLPRLAINYDRAPNDPPIGAKPSPPIAAGQNHYIGATWVPSA